MRISWRIALLVVAIVVLPIVCMVGVFLLLSGTAAAPFVYTLE